MNKKITTILFLINILTMLSCSTQLVQDSGTLSGIKNAGIIIRISRGSKITKDEFVQNTLSWLSNYKNNENIAVITDTSDAVSYYKYPQERFYQLSNENDYLKYKSIGVVNLYLQNNRNELSGIMSRNNLDSLIIYEVYNIISTEMQFLDFDSVLAVVDSGLNIAYLDHYTNHYDSESALLNELKNQMMDKINTKLMQDLQALNLLEDRMEGGNRNTSSSALSIKTKEEPSAPVETYDENETPDNDSEVEAVTDTEEKDENN